MIRKVALAPETGRVIDTDRPAAVLAETLLTTGAGPGLPSPPGPLWQR